MENGRTEGKKIKVTFYIENNGKKALANPAFMLPFLRPLVNTTFSTMTQLSSAFDIESHERRKRDLDGLWAFIWPTNLGRTSIFNQ